MDTEQLVQRATNTPNNLRFEDLVSLVEAFGFRLRRSRGSHQMFARPGIPELVNLQNDRGKAKPYQGRAFLGLIERYNLKAGDEPA
jgi:hypothetical protein